MHGVTASETLRERATVPPLPPEFTKAVRRAAGNGVRLRREQQDRKRSIGWGFKLTPARRGQGPVIAGQT